jgi:hypothetical protein
MKEIIQLLIPVILIGCVYDPTGIHSFVIANNNVDTFAIVCYINKKDSAFIIAPNDTIKIFEFVNNSGSYSIQEEEKIFKSFDSIKVQNLRTKLFQNISDYNLWIFNIEQDSKHKFAKSFYQIK